MIELEDDFSMLVYSSDTGFVVDIKKLEEETFVKLFNNQAGKTHGISTSYITNSNIGSAPVGDNGVLYGFTPKNVDDIRTMGAQDIGSYIADYGYWANTAQQFIMADDMSKYTTRLYNEFMINRDGLIPDYIVLFSDASQNVYNNSLKAASEFNIPIIKFVNFRNITYDIKIIIKIQDI